MNSVDTLKRAMFYVNGRIKDGPYGNPGEVVKSLPEEIRAELRKLKSSDIKDHVWLLREIRSKYR